MLHRPFPKIPTTLEHTAGAGTRWVATEKIHGAQLVVATDGVQVRLGKRKAWLESTDAFFGWQMLRVELSAAVQKIHRAMDRGGELFVYGELFGGHYPHPDVPAIAGLSAVQTGIAYAPGIAWSPFDALIVRGDDATFLAHSELQALCADAGLRTPPCLGRGTRAELSRLPVRYESQVSAALGLPALSGNVAEGFVLKPDAELPARGRPVVKHKIPEFDDNRFDQSRPFDANAHLGLPELLVLAEAMINPMRVASARSKVGEEADAIVEEMVLDVWIDLEAVFPRRMTTLGDAEADTFREALTKQARAAVAGGLVHA